jgi:hypothetical protein
MKTPKSPIIIIAFILCASSLLHAKSPYRISWNKDGYILGAGIVSSSTGYLLYHSVSSPTFAEVNQLSITSISKFDRNATDHYSKTIDNSSNILVGAFTAAPLILFSDKIIRDDWGTITLMYIEVWSFIGGTSMLSKGGIERYRPFVYNPNVPMAEKLVSDAKMSFFSNHAMIAFASAAFISTIYSDYYPDSEWKSYIWAGSLLSACIVGYQRYESGMHFPTDILVGAAFGSILGYVIPWMHREGKENISVAPRIYCGNYELSVHVAF